MRPVPINDAEAVIEAFWDPTRSDLGCYDFRPGDGTGAIVRQDWCWVAFFWQNATPGQSIFQMSRKVGIELSGYDAVRIRCAVPRSAQLTVTARVDGEPQTLIDGAVGLDQKQEYTGSVAGFFLEQITLIYQAIGSGAGGGTLQWINLVNLDVERRRLSRPTVYPPDWPGFLIPSGNVPAAAPSLNLLFDGDDLTKLRKKVNQPEFITLMEAIRGRAHKLREQDPERFVLESSPTINRHHRTHEIALGEFDAAGTVIACGFVGLVDQDPDLLRMAARAMLAMAHCRYWDECFQEHFPGSSFRHRSFSASDYSYACALGLDWAGSVLTGAGRRIIRDAIAGKGLPLIHRDFIEMDDIYHCNQAAHFSKGRIAGLLAMRSFWPRSQVWLKQAEEDLLESIGRIFNATEDHGGREGPSYYGATVYNALIGLMFLAKDRNRNLRDITPPSLKKSSDYGIMWLSTVGPAGSFVPYGDGHRTYDLDMVSLMALATGKRAWEELRRAMIHQRTFGDHAGGAYLPGLYTLLFTSPPPKPGTIRLPTFTWLNSTGMMESCRQTAQGPIRLQLIGAAEGAGHVHQDKGSFVLEAFGDILAMDRGCMNYGHPCLELIKKSQMHNVLSPAQIGEQAPEQANQTKDPVLPRGRGDKRALEAEIDTTLVWNNQFKKHIRRIISPEPTLIVIHDEVEFNESRGATFHLHSPWPIRRKDDGFVVQGQNAILIITPVWPHSVDFLGEDFLDGQGNPVNHLALTSHPAEKYHLVTILQILKHDTDAQWKIIEKRNRSDCWKVQKGKRQYLYRAKQPRVK